MWATKEQARLLWADAPLDDELLDSYLDAAGQQCEAFAPALSVDAVVPERYVVGQVMQARAIYRSLRAGSNDQMGAEGFAVTVFPLDWNVKALLRPRRGKPVMK